MRIRLAFLVLIVWAGCANAAPGWTEFPLPEGSGPHDVAPAPDGTVWFTAQACGALSRLDPSTGHVGAEGPSVRKRTLASCTQCPGRGPSGRELSIQFGFNGSGWPPWFVLHAM
jgi:hypothetical protein